MAGLPPAYGSGGGSGAADGFVAISNPIGENYVVGDKATQGALRFIPQPSMPLNVEVQAYNNDVWNTTGMQLAGATLFVGRELRIAAAGEWILTRDSSESFQALVPEIGVSDPVGTEVAVKVPKLGPIVVRDEVQPFDGAEIVGGPGNPIEFQYTSTNDRLSRRVYVRTGNQQPTAFVTATAYKGGFGGVVFFQQNFGAVEFGSNQEFQINVDGLVEITKGETVAIRFESTGPFSLKGTPTGFPYWALDYFTLEVESLISFESGLERILTGLDGHVLTTTKGNLIASGEGLKV